MRKPATVRRPGRRTRTVLIGLATGLAGLCAAGVAAAAVTYQAGKASTGTRVSLTVANRQVLEVTWAFVESCAGGSPLYAGETNRVGAKLARDGRFAKTLRYSVGDASLVTRFSGTITPRAATVTIHDQVSIPDYGFCSGSRTFRALRR